MLTGLPLLLDRQVTVLEAVTASWLVVLRNPGVMALWAMVLAGLAGAIAGGISMAAGEWISVSAQNEMVEREVAVERRDCTVGAS